MPQLLLVFDSTHHAIAAEHWMKETLPSQNQFQMIPTPRQITASCGLSLLLSGDGAPTDVLKILSDHDIQWAGLYGRESEKTTVWRPLEEDSP